jgi:hypothetical protein
MLKMNSFVGFAIDNHFLISFIKVQIGRLIEIFDKGKTIT